MDADCLCVQYLQGQVLPILLNIERYVGQRPLCTGVSNLFLNFGAYRSQDNRQLRCVAAVTSLFVKVSDPGLLWLLISRQE